MKDKEIETLIKKAIIIRKHIIDMIYRAGSGHPGGSLSCADILTVLYFHIMNSRDTFILSKGHAAPALYATLAEADYFPIDELKEFRQFGSRLQGHPDSQLLKGIEVSSGSLGQGLSIGCGISIANRLNKNKNNKSNNKTYVLLGDGECNEGQVWEAAMFANHYNLNNLIAIIDRNKYQIDGLTEKVMKLEPFADKWKSFGWNVLEIDGNNIEEIINALELINNNHFEKNKPTVIIAHTVKGCGISFMQNNNEYHGKAPNKEEYEMICKEIEIENET